MNYDQALGLLAEKCPEKFVIVCRPNGDGFNFGQGKKGFWLGEETQDDIDAILAEIGYMYCVGFESDVVPVMWYWDAYLIGTEYDQTCELSGKIGERHLSKLEAARAALIAVVEKLYGAEITAIREGKK